MERVHIASLNAGTALEAPMHDRSGRLLLAKGKELTEHMLLSLLRAGIDHVYLGEWDASEMLSLDVDIPLADYRGVADRMALLLQSAVEERLKRETAFEVRPDGEPLEASVDQSLQKNRPEGRIREWKIAHNHGVAFTQDLVEGRLPNEKVAAAATKVVGGLVDSLIADKSFLLNLASLKSKAQYLYFHSLNVSVLAINIASAMGLSRNQVMEVGVDALLHDLGMAMVPKEIVNAPRSLTEAERLDVQKHSLHVLYAIERMPGLRWTARYVSYQNHERCDGSGYPRMKHKSLIHPYARIAAVADVYDAMTSDRPWRKAYHPYRAMEHIIRQVPQGVFDGDVVRALLQCLSLFPLGSLVRLNTGEIAKVVHTNGDVFDRPVVSVLYDADEQVCAPPETVDLLEEDYLRIESLIEENPGVTIDAGF
jgi:HD-GYP domain-containing protein (c-di-GMP phosphodiesterase class II)